MRDGTLDGGAEFLGGIPAGDKVSAFVAQFRRDWLSVARARDEVFNPLAFLFLGVMLFALAFGGEAEALATIAPGVVWVLVLLANLMSLEILFRRDFEDGSLEQFVLLARPPFVAVLAKVAVQWCVTGLAMTVFAPVAALMLNMPRPEVPVLMLCLVVGTPALSLLGAVGAALTLGLRKGGVLLALLVLPLYLPVLIFGVGASAASVQGLPVTAQIYWLAGFTMLSCTLAPFAVAAALKISVEQS